MMMKDAMNIFTEYIENRFEKYLHDEYGYTEATVWLTHWDEDGEAHMWVSACAVFAGEDCPVNGECAWDPTLPIESAYVPWCAADQDPVEEIVDFEDVFEVYNLWNNSPQFLGSEDECEDYIHEAEGYGRNGLAIRLA